MRLWNFLALTILLLSASVVNAQAIRLRGTVLDPSGAVIPEADVKISQGNRVVIEGKSDSTGNFSFELPAGEYRVETSAAAFRSHQQNVRVAPNMRSLSITLALATLNAVVDVGQPDDKVSLEDDAKLTSTTIAGDDIKSLPEDEDALMAQLQALAAGTGAAGSTPVFLSTDSATAAFRLVIRFSKSSSIRTFSVQRVRAALAFRSSRSRALGHGVAISISITTMPA